MPVDSIHGYKIGISANPEDVLDSVKVENCFVWYSVTPDWLIVPIVATTNFLWT
ncbi:hypothetical protein ACUL41_04650 [Virgibacillus natechei]|uniref:hypothetical protein n=1 Tax=Virgibacillus sp. CBA3643 TaxID=2942278 RepID=UPI0035A303A7